MEARGEMRGGRFVSGFTGEQYARPEALDLLRSIRRSPGNVPPAIVSAADPLNSHRHYPTRSARKPLGSHGRSARVKSDVALESAFVMPNCKWFVVTYSFYNLFTLSLR
jgi:hypothetical protein